jgi:hypothetical protein
MQCNTLHHFTLTNELWCSSTLLLMGAPQWWN